MSKKMSAQEIQTGKKEEKRDVPMCERWHE